MNFYAVAIGKKPGIYDNWGQCAQQVLNYRGAMFKKFRTKSDAEKFIQNNNENIKIEYYLTGQPRAREEPPISKNLAYVEADESSSSDDEISKIIDKIYRPSFKTSYFVYTDGACPNNGYEGAEAGVGIYFSQDDTRNRAIKLDGKKTNNVAELSAIILLYDIIRTDLVNELNVVVVTDSEYAIKCVTTYGCKLWQERWKRNIPNKKLVKKAFNLYREHDNVRFMHVAAHTKNTDIHSIGNREADRLANLAIGRNV